MKSDGTVHLAVAGNQPVAEGGGTSRQRGETLHNDRRATSLCRTLRRGAASTRIDVGSGLDSRRQHDAGLRRLRRLPRPDRPATPTLRAVLLWTIAPLSRFGQGPTRRRYSSPSIGRRRIEKESAQVPKSAPEGRGRVLERRPSPPGPVTSRGHVRHSKWSSIKHKKAATDAKRGKLFTKLARAIAWRRAEAGGTDANFTLAAAIEEGARLLDAQGQHPAGGRPRHRGRRRRRRSSASSTRATGQAAWRSWSRR